MNPTLGTSTAASKPVMLPPDFNFLASQLGEVKERRQWVCWRLDPPIPGTTKWRKIPVTPGARRMAKTNAPATWRTFDDAVAWYSEHADVLAGIGYVFSKEDPFCGVDLDGCLDAAGMLAAWAESIVQSLMTYTERSPSGTGLKMLGRGKLPIVGTGRRVGQLEAYHYGRYFTVTGLLYGSNATINDCQSSIDQLWAQHFAQKETRASAARPPQAVVLSDDEVLTLASASRRGAKFERLFRGDWSQYQGQGEQSSADLALCSILAALVNGDAVRVDTLFRQSGLFRAKWDERHSTDGRTYGELTIAKALEGARTRTASVAPAHLPPVIQSAWNHAYRHHLDGGKGR